MTVGFCIWTVYWVWPWPLELGATVPRTMHWWDAHLNSWIIAEMRHNLLSGEGPLFGARVLYPNPGVLTYSENMLFPALLTLPFGGSSPLLVHNCLVLLGLAATAVTTWLWLRRRGMSVFAAAFGALLFAYAPFRLATIVKLQLVSAYFIPLFLLTFDRMLEAPTARRVTAWMLVMLGQLGTCVYYGVYLLIVMSPVVLLGFVRAQRQVLVPAAALRLAAGGVVLLAVVWFVFSPYVTVTDGLGLHRKDREIINTSGETKDIWTTSPLNAVDALPAGTVEQGNAREQVSFPGFTLLAAGLLGLFVVMKSGTPSDRAPFGASFHLYLMVVAMALFFGIADGAPMGAKLSPYRKLLDWLPALDGLRYPVRFMVFIAFGLAYFAARTLDQLLTRSPRAWAPVLGALALTVGAMELRAKPLPLTAIETDDDLDAALAQGDGAVLFVPLRGWHRGRIAKNLGTLTHGRPTLNGYSGFDTPLTRILEDYVKLFPSNASREIFRSLGVTTVVLPKGSSKIARARRFEWLTEGPSTDDWVVFNLAEPAPERVTAVRAEVRGFTPPALPTERLLPRNQFEVQSRYRPNDLKHMFDGDPKTRWTPRLNQGRHRRWLELTFKSPETLTALWLDQRHFPTDAPRGYRIEAQFPGSMKWHTLADVPLYFPVGHLAAAPGTALHRLGFPPTTVTALRLISQARSPFRWFSVGELHIERADYNGV